MLVNNKYNLGREYEFYATTPRVVEARDGCNQVRYNTQETKYKNNYPGGSSGGLPDRKGKRTVCSIYLLPTDQVTEEDMRELLEQLPAPMILLGDFNAHNLLWGSEKMNTRGRMMEKILDRRTFCALTKKKKPTTEHLKAANQQ